MLLGSVVISFVVITGAIQEEIKELIKDVPIAQFTVWDISKVSFFALPTMVGFIFPITFLLGILLTFGRMAHNSEIIAMKAAGIPMSRIVVPIVLAGLALSGLCFFIQDRGQPWAYRQLSRLLNSDLPLRISLDMLPRVSCTATGTGASTSANTWKAAPSEISSCWPKKKTASP